ncbi:DUF1403 family protein [Ketogulonicigenium vulgare]|uniref:DUF1403 family protein n=1 Tax=Ketogulonicigenium vulgare TaxID=92945 RepID=UPI002358494F|nr:DUF1403 family protein [Ketogulonicigenium vulgare]
MGTIANTRPTPTQMPAALPRWLVQGVGQQDAEKASYFSIGALICLDPLVRSAEPIGALWRKRLALDAAAAVCALEGRREGLGQLRDAFVLRGALDDPGPAGRQLLGWRYLGEARAQRSAAWAELLPGFFDLAPAPVVEVLRALNGRFVGRSFPLQFPAEAAAAVLQLGPQHRGLALWVADALLARALGWERAVPLLAAHLPRAAFRLEGEAWQGACAAAWGRGAVGAYAVYGELARRSNALLTVAPKLRGKDAAAIVETLLSEDAVAAQAGPHTSDRAARRLFERLMILGVVRELTGRGTFRLYGI